MWRWIYGRIGQMLCFSFGPFFGLFGASTSQDGNGTGSAIFGAGLILAGVGLKAIHHWRQRSDDFYPS